MKCVRRYRPGMKAYVINGSPRKSWNTAQAVDKAAEGLRDSGFDVERIDL